MDGQKVLDPRMFIKGLIARLVLEGMRGIYPTSPEAMNGFSGVFGVLDDKVEEEKGGEDSEWYRPLVCLRNELSPNNNGFFGSFVYHFYDQSLTFVSTAANDFNVDEGWRLKFDISPEYAQQWLSEYPERERKLIEDSVGAYQSARDN